MINYIQLWLKQRPIHLFYFIFITGFSILVIEFTAVSFLEPYCGKNNIIWALIIALVMTALCLGYILGGRYADAYKNIKKLYYLIGVSGIYLIGLPFFGKWIIHTYFFQMASFLTTDMLMVSGSFILTIILFGPPLITLAMTEPYIIKWYSSHLDNAGKRIGSMFSCATIGGLLGLYSTSLFLIPVIGSPTTLVYIGSLLTLSSMWMLKKRKIHFISILILCVLSIIAIANQPITGSKNLYTSLMYNKFQYVNPNLYDGKIPDVIYESETPYQYIQVAETNKSIWLLLGSPGQYYQSVYKKHSILTGKYYDYYYILPFLTQEPNNINILIIGLAGGSMSRGIKHFFPNSHIDGIEIDSEVIDVAKEYFELDSQNITVINQGGRQFLDETKKTYDIIILDTFSNANYIPWHLGTYEFFTLVKKRLKKDGILAINTLIEHTPVKDLITNTITSVFNYTYHHPNAQRHIAKQIVASNTPLRSHQLDIESSHPLYIHALFYKKSLTHVPHKEDSLILTDNKAPINYFMNKQFLKSL